MNAERPVSEIMTKQVISVSSNASLGDLEAIFEKKPIHHIMVVDEGALQGVISKNDLLTTYRANNGHDGVQAKDVMVANPMTVEPEDTIGLVSDIILANKFHSLPVVDDGELVGIVTNHDLIKYAYR